MSWFPDNYVESRERFIESAAAIGAHLSRFPINVRGMSDLSIDVAQIGSPDKPAVVITSGIHGVEASVGAAIQLAWLAAQSHTPTAVQYVLIHALNPYGYSIGRRVNENNIDLNRNFLDDQCDAPLLEGAQYNDYARFDRLLNPAYPPRRIDGFLLKAIGYLIRDGKKKLQRAIVTGQNSFPLGLFYAGTCSSDTVRIVHENIHQWIANAPEVCHLDFHTGLGRYAQCQLLVPSLRSFSDYTWYEQAFAKASLVATESADSSVYTADGAMGDWLMKHVDDRPYRFLTAEFGTYSALKVLNALRKENQAFHFSGPQSTIGMRSRAHLKSCFCPPSPGWRRAVLARGLEVIEQAGNAMSRKI